MKTPVTNEHLLEVMERRFVSMSQEFNQKFGSIDERFDSIDQRFGSIDQRFDSMDERFDRIETHVDDNAIHLTDLMIMTKVGFDDLSRKVDDNTRAIASMDHRVHRLTDIVYEHDLRLKILEKPLQA